MRAIFLAVTGIMLSGTAHANAEPDVQSLLAASKMTGICGVMQQMATFQTSTKMPGGDAFIERYWKTEFARLGMSQAEFFKACETSTAAYNQYWQLAEPSNK